VSAPSVLRRVSSSSLLASFGALSLVRSAAMAVVLGGVVHDRVESGAIARDGEAVEFLAGRLSSVVTAEEARTRPGRLPRHAVSQFLRYDRHGPEYLNVRI
jgi:hypothetical protein